MSIWHCSVLCWEGFSEEVAMTLALGAQKSDHSSSLWSQPLEGFLWAGRGVCLWNLHYLPARILLMTLYLIPQRLSAGRPVALLPGSV